MEDILHHLGCIKPCKQWDKLRINYLSTDAGFLPSTVFTDPQLIVNMPASPCHLTPIQSCSSSSICGGFKLPTWRQWQNDPPKPWNPWSLGSLMRSWCSYLLFIKWMCAFCWPLGARKPPELSTFLGTGIPKRYSKPSFASVTGWRGDPSYNINTWIVSLCRLFVQTQRHRRGAMWMSWPLSMKAWLIKDGNSLGRVHFIHRTRFIPYLHKSSNLSLTKLPKPQ